MRLGSKKWSIFIDVLPNYGKWHSGKYTLCISKGYFYEDYGDWVVNWWKWIPLGLHVYEKKLSKLGIISGKITKTKSKTTLTKHVTSTKYYEYVKKLTKLVSFWH